MTATRWAEEDAVNNLVPGLAHQLRTAFFSTTHKRSYQLLCFITGETYPATPGKAKDPLNIKSR